MKLFSWGIAAAILTAAAPAVAAPATSAERAAVVAQLQEIFADKELAHAHWGVLVESLDSGEVWMEINADRMFMPASNQKIPTAAAAILTLGPDFRFETHLTHSGTVADGVLDGDLIVFGNGDPTLYNRLMSDPREVFRKWAGVLKAKGVTRVTGRVIGDDNAWDDTHTGSGWPLRGLSAWYYAEYGPLQLNENYVDIRIIPPADASGTVTLEPNLPSNYYTLENNVLVSADGRTSVWSSRENGSNVIRVGGTVAAGARPVEESPTITNPTLWYVTVLRETLVAEGIAVEGEPVDCDTISGWRHTPADFTLMDTHQSRPLSDIVKGLMKRSQNVYAETMVYTMGWKRNGLGTFAGGREAVREALAQLGVAPSDFQFSDGSGLSRSNYISPRALTRINKGMYNGPHRDLWLDVMPIAGVDGTLRSRMKGTAAEGNVRAKTGFIGNVRGLSGFVTTAAGEKLVFSTLCNGYLSGQSSVDRVVDSALVVLASYDHRAAAK